MFGDAELGYVEVESREEPGRQPLHGGWADIGNLHVVEAYRRKRIGTYLIGQAADWLDLARLDRVLDYAWAEDHAPTHFCALGVQAIALPASVER